MGICKNIFPTTKKIGLLLTALWMGVTFGPANPQAAAKEREILLLHSNNVTGYLFPCPT